MVDDLADTFLRNSRKFVLDGTVFDMVCNADS